jgi:nicotinamide-nucleotide amidase
VEGTKLEIVTIGDEILSGSILDTNSAMVAEKFMGLGLEVHQMTSIGDEPQRIQEILRKVAARSQLAIVTGGLGPTEDDRTAQAAAEAFGRSLVLHEPSLQRIRERFERFGIEMTPNNERQAWMPYGAEAIPNPLGTAPGFAMLEGQCMLLFFPGVPRELERMLDEAAIPMVARRFPEDCQVVSRSLKVFGLTEAKIDEMVRGLLDDMTGVSLASLPRFPEIRLRITARTGGGENALEILQKAEFVLRQRIEPWVYGVDDNELETVVYALLKERRKTVAVAESCTGGLVTHRLTNVPGSSEILDRGFVAYSPPAKEELLGVPKALLNHHGPVSAAAAEAMAVGARERANTTLGLSVTGVAGPGGGDERIPVGTVFVGLAAGRESWSQRFLFPGGRSNIKILASTVALDWLRRYLLDEDPSSYMIPWREARHEVLSGGGDP